MDAGERLMGASRMAGQGSSPLGRFFQRAGLTAVAVVTAGAVLMFSAVLMAVLVVLGLVGWAWLWWRGRSLRKAAPMRARPGARADAMVLEGEVIREVRD